MSQLIKRHLCWSEDLIEKSENLLIPDHKPEKKNIAFTCDEGWEGYFQYAGIVKVKDGYRIYARSHPLRWKMPYKKEGYQPNIALDGYNPPEWEEAIAVYESRDGINFTKPILNKIEYFGTKQNNIVFHRDGEIDNFSVFYDENPNCPEEERFKALSAFYVNHWPYLRYYASADGYEFTYMRDLPLQGVFDSYQTIVWDKNTEQYFVYYRDYHDPVDGSNVSPICARPDILRDIRVATSKDFVEFVDHGRIKYESGEQTYQPYTNQIMKYFRDEDTFIAFPARYNDRIEDKHNFAEMPYSDYRLGVMETMGRVGSVATDCGIMTSADGFTFRAYDEAFVTPGPEAYGNWWYGDCYSVYGMALTPSDTLGADDEISMYFPEREKRQCRRYTIRQDGFFSWYGKHKGAVVLTKPVEVKGDLFVINFATSALGGLRITLCNENGESIEGYDSGSLFGNKVDRPVRFEKTLSELCGKRVRLKMELNDAHLYSFAFCKE